ncbi:MAG: ABC transporter permease [Anaerolineae bacterium]
MSASRFYWLLRKEAVLALRNMFLAIIVGLALLYAATLTWVVPEEVSVEPALYYAVTTPGAADEIVAWMLTPDEQGDKRAHQVDSRKAVLEGMRREPNSIGLVIDGDAAQPEIEMVFQGHESEQVRNALRLSIQDNLARAMGAPQEVQTIMLGGTPREVVPMNKFLLPIFLLSEATMVGFILIASLVFIEKSEGTLRAFRVSPGRVAEYLGAKVAVMALLGVIFTLVLTPLVAGLRLNYVALLALVLVGSVVTSSLALLVASYFPSLTQSIVVVMFINLLLGLPILSYVIPSFAPALVRALPTYPLILNLREVLFYGAGLVATAPALGTLALWAAALFGLAVIVYQRRLALA